MNIPPLFQCWWHWKNIFQSTLSRWAAKSFCLGQDQFQLYHIMTPMKMAPMMKHISTSAMKLHESQRSIWTLDFQSNLNRVLLFLSVNSHQQNEVFSTTNKMAGHKLEGEWSQIVTGITFPFPPSYQLRATTLSMLLVLIYTLQTTWMGHFKYELPLPFTVDFWEWSLMAYCLLPGMTIEIYNSTIT